MTLTRIRTQTTTWHIRYSVQHGKYYAVCQRTGQKTGYFRTIERLKAELEAGTIHR